MDAVWVRNEWHCEASSQEVPRKTEIRRKAGKLYCRKLLNSGPPLQGTTKGKTSLAPTTSASIPRIRAIAILSTQTIRASGKGHDTVIAIGAATLDAYFDKSRLDKVRVPSFHPLGM